MSLFSEKRTTTSSQKGTSSPLLPFLCLGILFFPGIVKLCAGILYETTFRLDWLLLARVADLFYNETTVPLYLILFLLLVVLLFLFPNLSDILAHFRPLSRAFLITGLFLLTSLSFQFLRKDIYTIDHQKVSKLEAVTIAAAQSAPGMFL